MLNHFCKSRKRFLIILAGFVTTLTAAHAGYAQGSWTALTPAPSPTEGMTVGGVGQVIVGAYGFSSTLGATTNQTRLYNISSDSWSAGATAPSVTNEVDVYDPQTDTWTTLTPMPTQRASLVAGHSGNLVYAIGGTDGVSALNVNEVYDISGNSWSTNTPMATALQESGAHSHGGKVYVVGGSTPAYGSSSNANEVFKP